MEAGDLVISRETSHLAMCQLSILAALIHNYDSHELLLLF
jgi:hypothetical protein